MEGEKSMRRTFGKSCKVADRSGGNIRQSFLCKKCCKTDHEQQQPIMMVRDGMMVRGKMVRVSGRGVSKKRK